MSSNMPMLSLVDVDIARLLMPRLAPPVKVLAADANGEAPVALHVLGVPIGIGIIHVERSDVNA